MIKDSEEQELQQLRPLVRALMKSLEQWCACNSYCCNVVHQLGAQDEHAQNLAYLHCFVEYAMKSEGFESNLSSEENFTFNRLSHLSDAVWEHFGNPPRFDLVVPADTAEIYSDVWSSLRSFTGSAGLRIPKVKLLGYAKFPETLFLKTRDPTPEYYRLVKIVHGIVALFSKSGILFLPSDCEYDAYELDIYTSSFVPWRAFNFSEEHIQNKLLNVAYKLTFADLETLETFAEDWNNMQEDPFLSDHEQAGVRLHFLCGSEESLRSLLTHVYNVCCTDDDFRNSNLRVLRINSSTENDTAHIACDDFDDADCGEYIDSNCSEIVYQIIEENTPEGWSWEYNDGAYDRVSGHDLTAEMLQFTFAEPSEHEVIRSIKFLRQWCKERSVALPQHLQTNIEKYNNNNPAN